MADNSFSSSDVVRIAREWIGTPYHHQASIKGTGTDCLGLVRGVWRELYGFDVEQAPAYTPDWAEANGAETMLEAAGRHLVKMPRMTAQAGEVMIFRFRAGAVAKHAGICVEAGYMVHAQEGVAVAEVALSEWWKRRVAGVYSFPGVSI